MKMMVESSPQRVRQRLRQSTLDTSSIDSGEDCNWQGADKGLDYTFGHGDLDEHAASNATLVPSATVNLNASVSYYAAPCPSGNS